MALSHIYCNKFSFETLDVISVWLLLCYKSFKYCVVSALLIQGWHWSTEIGPFEVWSLHSHKHEYPAQARVLAHFAAIFDLLAQSTSHKTACGDCSLVCDSSIGPISFCSSALFIANLCCLGDHVLELACQIYMVLSSFDAWYRL